MDFAALFVFFQIPQENHSTNQDSQKKGKHNPPKKVFATFYLSATFYHSLNVKRTPEKIVAAYIFEAYNVGKCSNHMFLSLKKGDKQWK